MMRIIAVVIIAASCAWGQVLQEDPSLQAIDVEEHLGQQISLNLTLTDHYGDDVRLKDFFFRGLPVVLVMHYTNCEMLCSLVLNGLAQGLKTLGFQAGKDYQVISISIDPDETWERSRLAYERYSQTLMNKKITPPTGAPDPWVFLTGDSLDIRQITQDVGFKYYKVASTGEFAHAAVIMILTEEGMLSRYLYGIEFPERDLRLSLIEASEGKIGSSFDKLILYCFHYDPNAQGYVIFAGNVMRIGGSAAAALLVLLLIVLWKKEKTKSPSNN